MERESERKIIVFRVVGLVCLGLVLGVMYASGSSKAATLHTQVIKPRPNVECVVVSATESTSVDCWKLN